MFRRAFLNVLGALLLTGAWVGGAAAQINSGPIDPGITSLRFVDSRARLPNISVAATVGGNNLAVCSEQVFFTPGFPVKDLRFLFPAWFVNINGVSAPETNIGNTIGVYFSMEVAAGPWVTGTIGAQSPATISDGLEQWSDVVSTGGYLAPYTRVTTRTLIFVNDTQARPGGLRTIATGGVVENGARRSATVATLVPCLAGGSMTSLGAAVSGIDLDLYGPGAAVGTAVGSPRSILVNGDSIDYDRSGTLTNSDAHQNQGMWAPAIFGAGYGSSTMAIQGLKMQFEGATDATAGYVKRPRAILALPSLPMDTIVTGLQHNDTSGATFTTMKNFGDKTIARYKSFFPTVRIGWAGPMPFTTGTFTTVVGQTQNAAAISPAGAAWAFRDYMKGLAGGTIQFFIDRSLAGGFSHQIGTVLTEDIWWTGDGNNTAYTLDGTHPIDVMHALLATWIQTQVMGGVM